MVKNIAFIRAIHKSINIIWKSSPTLAYGNICLQLLLAIIPLANLYILKGLVDLVINQETTEINTITWQVIYLLIVQIVNAGLIQLSQYLQNIQLNIITDYVSNLVINKAINVPYSHYENSDYHDSLHLAQFQALHRLPILTNAINQLVQQGMNVLFLSVFFITLKWYYFFLFLLIGLPLAFVRWYYSNKKSQLEKKQVGLERQSNYLNLVLTSLAYAKEVRIFGYGKSFHDKFKSIRQKIFTEKKAISYKNSWAGFWAQLIEIISICFIYLSIAIQTFKGIISIGSFVMYFQAFQRVQTSLRSFLESLVQIFQLRLFLNDLFSFLEIAGDTKQTLKVLPSNRAGIEILNVSFTYPGGQKEVIKNVSLTCRPGNLIALVGENGSGKSTLVKLLTGLYPVQKGKISIDGTDINLISNEDLRNKMSVIFQDFNMYDATVNENIALGLPISEKKIIESAEASGAKEFINKLPTGYDTFLGRAFYKSEQLSGGQWQKLALARAFYRDHEIIILDEPTSQVDPIAEFDIFENLGRNLENKIVLLITHRLYNLKKAHRIYTMHDGEIVEQGSFAELILKDGLFKMMYHKQKL